MSKSAGDGGSAGGLGSSPMDNNSSAQSDQHNSSQGDITLESVWAFVQDQEKRLRSFQGDENRATNRALDGLKNLSERFTALEMQAYGEKLQSGMTSDKAIREIKIDRILSGEIPDQQLNQTRGGNQSSNSKSGELDNYFSEFGLDPNAPESVAFIQKGDFSDVAKTKFVMENVGKAPDATTSFGTGGGKSNVISSREDEIIKLSARLIELQRDPLSNRSERTEIMKKLAVLTPRE